MGLENRDYMRDETSASFARGGSPALHNIVKTLIIINVMVFLAQLFIKAPISLEEFPSYFDVEGRTAAEIEQGYLEFKQMGSLPEIPVLNQWFTLDSEKVFRGQIWRLTTYDFLHSTRSIWHIFFNMWLLYISGKPVADKYGSREFLWFYLLAGVFSALFYIGWGMLNRENVAAVGASGAVSAVLVLYALNWPYHRWYIYGVIPMPVMLLVLISAGMDLFPMLQQLSGAPRTSSIAHAAHIGGMFFGFLYFKGGVSLTRFVPQQFRMRSLFRGRSKPKLKLHRPIPSIDELVAVPPRKPIPTEVARRVDELLEKISQSGEASLTADEREFLHESSRKYR